MKKITLLLTTFVLGFTFTQTECRKNKDVQKASAKKMSAEEYNFWSAKAEQLAQNYKFNNPKMFENVGNQIEEEQEGILALTNVIKELKNSKSQYASGLADAYKQRHPSVKKDSTALKEVIKIFKQIKKDWSEELLMANEGPEAAYL